MDYTFFTEPVSCEVRNDVGSTNVSTLVDVHCEWGGIAAKAETGEGKPRLLPALSTPKPLITTWGPGVPLGP